MTLGALDPLALAIPTQKSVRQSPLVFTAVVLEKRLDADLLAKLDEVFELGFDLLELRPDGLL